MWCPKDRPATIRERPVSPNLAMITVLDTDGRVYFSLNHANTDSQVMILFIHRLVDVLNQETPDWTTNSVILLDNATWHKSPEVIEAL